MAVKSYVMNSTGGKSVFEKVESDSLAHSMTNFSKNAPEQRVKITANDVFVQNKRNKKKNLPSLLDDSRVSPRGQFQFVSTDFSKNKKKRNDPLGGYETDFTGGGGFASTYEDGFPGVFESTVDGDAKSSTWKNAGDSSIEQRVMRKHKIKK
jgi:hypothetical protein